jgi:hypothetical protein
MEKIMNTNREEEERLVVVSLRDINSGEQIPVIDPKSFFLQTVLINSAYYLLDGKEYRFLLCQARKAGLETEKKLAA